MLDAPARLPSSLADDGWRARVSRTTRPGELYYYNRDRANKRLWSLEEVKAFSARSAPPGWCVKNADKALAASLQMLLALLVVFGFLEACIGAFNLVYEYLEAGIMQSIKCTVSSIGETRGYEDTSLTRIRVQISIYRIASYSHYWLLIGTLHYLHHGN